MDTAEQTIISWECPGCKVQHQLNPYVYGWDKDSEALTLKRKVVLAHNRCTFGIDKGIIAFGAECQHALGGCSVEAVSFKIEVVKPEPLKEEVAEEAKPARKKRTGRDVDPVEAATLPLSDDED